MEQTTRPIARGGRIVIRQVADRWTAQLELNEHAGDQASRLRVDVPGEFASEATAQHAAQAALDRWCTGQLTLRELVLRQLAAAYRRLREKHKPMEPVAVPTTGAAWERALTLWELAGWLDAPEAARYRQHVRRAFDAAATTVKRHRLADAKPDPAS
ncbi:MAG TPA: hypothetical protein VNO26_07940 [Candidatus Limnocylindria bacterium]|nr:hypothetical protein [Candidatus Limnocylindria bacterium]